MKTIVVAVIISIFETESWWHYDTIIRIIATHNLEILIIGIIFSTNTTSLSFFKKISSIDGSK